MGVTVTTNVAGTYTPIATQTLSSGTSSVVFNSIPSTYSDLILIYSTHVAGIAQTQIQFNSDTSGSGTNYSNTQLYTTGSSPSSNANTNNYALIVGADAGTGFSTNTLHIMNYANTNIYKTCLARRGSTDFVVSAFSGTWRSTAAINSITVSSGTFTAGSTFTLYGIKGA